jgi:hypothetical protein
MDAEAEQCACGGRQPNSVTFAVHFMAWMLAGSRELLPIRTETLADRRTFVTGNNANMWSEERQVQGAHTALPAPSSRTSLTNGSLRHLPVSLSKIQHPTLLLLAESLSYAAFRLEPRRAIREQRRASAKRNLPVCPYVRGYIYITVSVRSGRQNKEASYNRAANDRQRAAEEQELRWTPR